MALLPVEEALRRVLDGVLPHGTERVALPDALGRVLAEDLVARRTQPDFDCSAMDGYAIRHDDVAEGAEFTIIGESAAGHGYSGNVGQREAVRIFTGAPVPAGADTIVIQENVTRRDASITLTVPPRRGANIRPRGLDFREGAAALAAGTRLNARDLALAAATNHAELPVSRRPLVAVLATGDELVMPGNDPGPGQIVASNSFALAAMARQEGADVLDLGIAGDSFAALQTAIGRARDAGADILVTIGGASVGDHDLVQEALAKEGMTLGFWKIAMRPGKPLMHGALGPMRVLGMPGNPVSAIVCGVLFLLPLLRRMTGRQDEALPTRRAQLAVAWPANDMRQDYLRAAMTEDRDGTLVVTPFAMQDSSMVSVLASADCLVIRPPHAPKAEAGDECSIIDLRSLGI
jgi:molybdopterin molybdotransferase